MHSHWPFERRQYRDLITHLPVTQWTSSSATDQHLYFTCPSVTADDRWLVFLSDRTGQPNIFVIDRRDGSIRQVSRNDDGLLRSYVYPRGGRTGLSKASPCLDAQRNRVYYIQNDRVWRADLDASGCEPIFDLPAGWYTAYNQISPDGRLLCVPCTDPRAFPDGLQTQWQQLDIVPERMVKEGFTCRLYFIDTATGKGWVAKELPFWVSHVQFDPAGTGRLLHNREGFGPYARPRIWCLETDGRSRPLGDYPATVSWAHEYFSPDGAAVIYHGWDGQDPFLAMRHWDGSLIMQQPLPGFSLGHVTMCRDGVTLITDGIDGFVSLIRPEPTGPVITHLCKHDTDPSLQNQDAHAHPVITPSGTSIVFTSDRGGSCNVYEVAAP